MRTTHLLRGRGDRLRARLDQLSEVEFDDLMEFGVRRADEVNEIGFVRLLIDEFARARLQLEQFVKRLKFVVEKFRLQLH